MPVKRGTYSGDRPSVEFQGKTYKHDYDLILKDGDSVKKEGSGLRITWVNASKHGNFRQEISHPDAIMGESGANHDPKDVGNAQVFGIYIHQP